MSNSESLRPAVATAIKEAASVKALGPLSLLMLGVLIVGAYIAGRDAGRGVSETKIDMLIERQTQSLEAITASTKAIEVQLQMTGQTVHAVDGRVQQLSGSVSAVSSRVEDLHRSTRGGR